MTTVADLRVGDTLEPNRRVYHVTELSGGYRSLTIEKLDQGGHVYTTYLHGSTPLADARGGGSYKGDAHLA